MGTLLKNYMLYVKGSKKNFVVNSILTPASWLTGAAVSFINFFRVHGLLKTEEPPLPLISVGNLTYGGTNKTPFVRMLAEYALARDIKVGIVTRGYSGKSDEVLIIRDGEGERSVTGDEPLLLSRKLPGVPVAVARMRMDGVRALKSEGVELVIADDAFQHRGMSRDADIVLIDAVCPFGSGKLIPAGMLRERISALRRADIVVLTKSKRVSPEELAKLRSKVSEFIAPEKIFTSEIDHDGWILFNDATPPARGSKVFAFSAIGSPESFTKTLNELGLTVVGAVTFRDHHSYSRRDLENLYADAKAHEAAYMSCTEKDLYNLPEMGEWSFDIPLVIPKVRVSMNEREKFFQTLTQTLRPKIIIASNGYGEDAIGVMLAKKFRDRLPGAEVSAFPLVGRGDAYIKENFEIKSAPSITPSGGVLKYSVKDLWGDMRAGLLKHVRAQLNDWTKLAGRVRTPVCVGDVYLLLHTLWGTGARPMFAATAKTVYLSGHWRLERFLINRFTLRTWTRDAKSAEQLGRNSTYAGSPIMDLLGERFHYERGDVILLLPGSRARANSDVKLLLDASEIMSASGEKIFRMVLAPTLDFEKFFEACKSYGWLRAGDTLTKGSISISLSYDSVANSVSGVKLLVGLGGTANQLCAGLGIPVISIDEKGKRVQKKLLGDSEILVEATPEALAECALNVLRDKRLYDLMSSAGRERMGSPGAIDDIVKFACGSLGWDVRERVYKIFAGEELGLRS